MQKAKKKITKYKERIRFEVVFNAKSRQRFHWRIRSCNGQIICHSENYRSEAGPIKTIKSFISAIKKGQFRIEDTIFAK